MTQQHTNQARTTSALNDAEEAAPRSSTARKAPGRSYTPLRVMTFNVLYHGAQNAAGDWQTRRRLVADVIESWRPCVVGFQEATELQLEQLAQDNTEYDVVTGPLSGTTRLPGWVRRGERVQDAGEWCPLFYRRDLLRVVASDAFWLSHQADEPGSVLPGTWLPRVVNWARFAAVEGGHPTVSIFNTHFDFLPWAAKRSARILWERLHTLWDGTAQVVVGDFNAAPGSAIHRCLLRDCVRHYGSPTFRDAWEVAAHREGPFETYHGGRGRRRWPGRIDHIFFRPAGLHVERCTTITHGRRGRFPSDHYPVLAEFERWPSAPHPPLS